MAGKLKTLSVAERAERIRELEGKIVALCINNRCTHLKSLGGLNCDRKRSQCHSKRVIRMLAEIVRLQDEDSNHKSHRRNCNYDTKP